MFGLCPWLLTQNSSIPGSFWHDSVSRSKGMTLGEPWAALGQGLVTAKTKL